MFFAQHAGRDELRTLYAMGIFSCTDADTAPGSKLRRVDAEQSDVASKRGLKRPSTIFLPTRPNTCTPPRETVNKNWRSVGGVAHLLPKTDVAASPTTLIFPKVCPTSTGKKRFGPASANASRDRTGRILKL